MKLTDRARKHETSGEVIALISDKPVKDVIGHRHGYRIVEESFPLVSDTQRKESPLELRRGALLLTRRIMNIRQLFKVGLAVRTKFMFRHRHSRSSIISWFAAGRRA